MLSNVTADMSCIMYKQVEMMSISLYITKWQWPPRGITNISDADMRSTIITLWGPYVLDILNTFSCIRIVILSNISCDLHDTINKPT